MKGLIQMTNRITGRVLSAFLTLAIAITCIVTPQTSIKSEAAESKTGIGLAEFGLQAYKDGWQYSYGAWGNYKVNGKYASDCSGLIYAYLIWNTAEANASPNYFPTSSGSWPRGAQSQYNFCSQTGSISTLPRTHGILIFFPNCDHVGIYVGNGYAVDNSDYGTNMVYKKVDGRGWVSWGKLQNVSYPTNGWYKFNGKVYYYQNGEYVINKTLTIDGTKYTFSSAGIPNPTPKGYTTGGGIIDDDSSVPDNTSVTMYVNATGGLYVRSGPGTSYSAVAVASNGSKLTVTNKYSSSWYKVKLSDGTVGFCSAEYLKSSSSSATATPKATATPNPNVISVPATTTGWVYLRSSTSSSSKALKVVSKGVSVTITNKSNSKWYRVKLADGTEGYIFSAYLKTTTLSPYTAKITKSCNLLKNAYSSASKVTKLKANDIVTVTKRSGTGKYYYVTTSSGSKGWVYWSNTSKTSTISGTTTAKINLRQRASTSSSVVRIVNKGVKVTVVSYSTSGWLKVVLSDGTSGWMSSKYVYTTVKAKTTATSGLNVRSGASMNGKIKTTVPYGSTVTIISFYNKSWYKIKLSNGTIGFASTDYLKIS